MFFPFYVQQLFLVIEIFEQSNRMHGFNFHNGVNCRFERELFSEETATGSTCTDILFSS